MEKLAQDLSRIVNSVAVLDEIAEKVASDNSSFTAQQSTAAVADAVYEVICKEASAYPAATHLERVEGTIVKLSHGLGKEPVDDTMRLKLAAAIAVDEALSGQLVDTRLPDTEVQKIAETRAYGREYMVSLLREVL